MKTLARGGRRGGGPKHSMLPSKSSCIRVLALLAALCMSLSMGYWFIYRVPTTREPRTPEYVAPHVASQALRRQPQAIPEEPQAIPEEPQAIPEQQRAAEVPSNQPAEQKKKTAHDHKTEDTKPDRNWSSLLSTTGDNKKGLRTREEYRKGSSPREISESDWELLLDQCTSNSSKTSCHLQQATVIAAPERTMWGPPALQESLKQMYDRICTSKTKRNRGVKRVHSKSRASPQTLIQTSVSTRGVGFEVRDVSKVPQDKTKIYDSPTCDLRRCDQSRYPFIYFLLPERNRVGNAERMIRSMRNATSRCDVAPWLPCLCFYIIDFNTTMDDAMLRLHNSWPGHVRVLRKQEPTEPWMKTQTLSYGSYSVPTPADRSLVFHVDADMVALDDGFVDNALEQISERPRAYLPIVRTTKKEVQDVEGLWKEARNPTSPYITWRMPGVGMIFYLLGDFRTEFPYVLLVLVLCLHNLTNDGLLRRKSSARKTDWGSEDWEFFSYIRRKISAVRYVSDRSTPAEYSTLFHHDVLSCRRKEEWLIHIYHPKVSWKGSQDGITLG
eukprot:gb/GECG01004832.1/.p1 GENE.gb/GECG01004832.1/~~gb/GECG01004832.1/.p1  ORF type:complete len:555 (+),score=40.89 gb/GECG01004832.1/:1-1665(+)